MARLFPCGRARNRAAVRRPLDVVDAGVTPGGGDASLRRRVAALGCALSLGMIAVVAPPVLADERDKREDLTERKADLNDDLQDATSELDETSARLVRASGDLRAAQTRLDLAQRNLASTRGELTAARNLDEQMQADLEDAEQRLADAETAVERTDAHIDTIREDIGDFVASSYQYGSPGLLSLGAVINEGDTTDIGENLALADSVVGAQAATLDELNAEEVLRQVEQERVEELRNEVALKRDAAADNLSRQRELTRQAMQQAKKVREIVRTRSEAKQRAAAAKQVELDRIARLESSRERVKGMLLRLAQRNQPGPTVTTVITGGGSGGGGTDATGGTGDTNGGDTDGGDTDGGDTDGGGSGGYLSWPVEDSSVTSPYGMRMHPILRVYKLHDGTDLGASCGVPVYAAAAGKIVSTYYDGAYGNRVIMANGTIDGVSLSTSYNHLTSDTVAVGESVSRGQVIGYAGTTGYSTGCHLHFMVYSSGSTTDPMDWLS